MPWYGKKNSYKKKTSKAANTNIAVSKIQGKKHVPKQTKNTMSIMTLAKQVKALQVSKLGPVQSVREAFEFPVYGLFDAKRPIMFCANDFIDPGDIRAPIYGLQDNTLLRDAPYVMGRWSLNNGPTGPAGNDDDFNFWYKSNDNHCSQEIYSPIKTNICIKFAANMYPANRPMRFRIDVIRQKKLSYQSSDHALQLPDAMLGLNNLHHTDMLLRNRINKEYFEVIQTKFMYMKNPATSGPDYAQVRSECYAKLSIPFDRSYIKPDIDSQGSSQDHAAFYKNVDPKKLIWVLISPDFHSGPASDNNLSITMCRHNVWRDQHGTD